jgi:glycosyltransferase involved in cell wall biosynthesis
MIGHVDEWSRDSVHGWAWDPAQPDSAVTVEICVDGRALTTVLANHFRADLQRAGLGTGRYGFSVDLPDFGSVLSSHKLTIRVAGGREDLRGSPILLAASMGFDVEAERAFAALLASPGSAAQLRKRLMFLTAEVDNLLERMDDLGPQHRKRAIARGRKWRWRAEDGPEPAPAPLRALVIDEATPAPGRDAGSNAVLSHMAALQRIGYEVSFVAAEVKAGPNVDHLSERGITVHVSPWTGSVEEVLRRQSGQFDLVYMHRLSSVMLYGKLVANTMRGARRIYGVADLHHVGLRRQAESEGSLPQALHHAEQVRRHELLAAAESHAVVTHSTFEAQLLQTALPRARVIVAPWDCERAPLPGGFAQRINLAFVGNFRRAADRDAAIWLASEIMPLVWQTDPTIACFVVGADPPKYLRAIDDSRIRMLGAVTDLDEVLAQVRLTVAPLLFGAGLQGEVIESLAAGVPCVCSPIAAEGCAFTGVLGEVVVDGAVAFAAGILRVHGAAEAFERLRTAGIEHVRAHFTKTLIDERLRAAAGLPAGLFA